MKRKLNFLLTIFPAALNEPTAIGETATVAPPAVLPPAPVVAAPAVRLQDSLVYTLDTLDQSKLPFGPLADTNAQTDRWFGVLISLQPNISPVSRRPPFRSLTLRQGKMKSKKSCGAYCQSAAHRWPALGTEGKRTI